MNQNDYNQLLGRLGVSGVGSGFGTRQQPFNALLDSFPQQLAQARGPRPHFRRPQLFDTAKQRLLYEQQVLGVRHEDIEIVRVTEVEMLPMPHLRGCVLCRAATAIRRWLS